MRTYISIFAFLLFASAAFSEDVQKTWSDSLEHLKQLVAAGSCDSIISFVDSSEHSDALVATLYDTGTCLPTDNERASEYYLKAAEAGNAGAMYALWTGVMERNTAGDRPTDAEFEEAEVWLEKSAELHNWRASYVLALCYREGACGREKNVEKAEYFDRVFRSNAPEDQLAKPEE
jgi:TPR repeat protein